ncbi:trypco2 family protein [Glycomyces sp. NRRL B-16210]|uniref:trypco2 family protein n=1 Tax=Glycomyces sp. NRRL B-16210 TaxID=1463821 RepID=UPI0004BE98A1|nr:trypco2 family protein [Glycomyces sp. NRRL B-16210]
MTNLSLADAIASLRTELRAAIDASDKELPLEVQELELELTLEASSKTGAEAGVNLWSVITGKVSAEDADTHTHRLRIVLNPKTVDEKGKTSKAKLSSEF